MSFSIWITDDFPTKETVFYFSESIDFDNFDCLVLYFFCSRVTDLYLDGGIFLFSIVSILIIIPVHESLALVAQHVH